MLIKKLGHCCLHIKLPNLTILTDPGSYSTLQNEVKGIDLILITHEHGDHFHIESLKKVLMNNPDAKIITNVSVGKLLDVENIPYSIISDGQSTTIENILIEGFGTLHEEIYDGWGRVENTGYFIDNKLFYPGDAFTDPKKPVDILALPVSGPWMKIHEAIDYALLLKPRVVFPVHDAILKNPGLGHAVPSKFLLESNIEFVVMNEDDEHEF
ncbi:MBL fold metallo-hydrolase [Candidatus Nomurabacteria bacterium]|nr:MAG: MBL fold metallo-hydrolase [Candidatus Nomurabacteria bacterium]